MSRASKSVNYREESSDEETFGDNDFKTTKKSSSVKKPEVKRPIVKEQVTKEKSPSAKRAREESEESESDSNSDDDDDDGDDAGESDDSEGSGSGSGDDDGDDAGEDGEQSDDDAKKPAAKRKAPVKANAKKTASKKSKASSKKSKKTKKSQKAKKSSGGKSSGTKKDASSDDKERKPKKLTKLERLDEASKAYKWWEAEELPAGINWHRLEHAGVLFAPPYIQHGVPLLYNGERIALNAEQEEIASFYAAIPEDGPQLGNPKVRKVFQNNFFADFKESLETGSVIKKFSECDFSLIKAHHDMQKDLKKAATDAEKKSKKDLTDQVKLKHSFSLIDGRMEKVGNYNMEIPGLFRGRGEHPKTGVLKKRCFSESVGINIGEEACPPISHLPGHAWKDIRHDNSVTWLCDWQENVNNQHKYVMLAPSSSFKGKSDTEKYTKAITLKACIHKIRKDYTKKMKSVDSLDKQIGTAMWVIDILALRVGGEKGDDEADTVGCCSLRVEHFKFAPDGVPEIELEFLGKDSMLFKQTINFAKYNELGMTVFENLKNFSKKKKPDEQVFRDLTPSILNEHLSSLMEGLSAKVFRTYNASETLQKELPSAESLEGLSVQDKVLQYNAANREVAILCNHQRTVSNQAAATLEVMSDRIETLKTQLRELSEWKALAAKKKGNKIPLKKSEGEQTEKAKGALDKALLAKQTASSNEDKIAATQAEILARELVKTDQKRRFLDLHYFSSEPSTDKIDAKIVSWGEKIKKMEVDLRDREENKEVALGTSKINYMDPRISVAWCKRCEVPIDKIFSRTLRDKFNWAMAVPPGWLFGGPSVQVKAE